MSRMYLFYRIVPAILVTLISWLACGGSLLAGADPVKDLEEALSARPPNPDLVYQMANQLYSLSDLSRAVDLALLQQNYPRIYREILEKINQRINSIVDSGSPATRRAVAELIGQLGSSSNNLNQAYVQNRMWPNLQRLAHDKDSQVRQAALLAMGTVLPKYLPDYDREFLSKMSLEDLMVIAAKVDVLRQAATIVQDAIRNSKLDELEKLKAPKLTLLELSLSDEVLIRQAVENLMGKIDVAQKELVKLNKSKTVTLVPALAENLETGTPTEQQAAAKALAMVADELGREFSKVALINSPYSTNGRGEVLAAVAAAVEKGIQADTGQVQFQSLLALQELTSVLKDKEKNPTVLKIVQPGLNDLIKSASFKKILISPSPEMRVLALRSLENIARAYGSPSPTVPVPSSVLQKKNAAVQPVRFQQRQQPKHKGELFKSLQSAAKEVGKTLNHPDIRVRLNAINFLESMVAFEYPLGIDVAKSLAERTEDRDNFVRWAAARAIGTLGRKRLKVAPKLNKEQMDVLRIVVKSIARLVVPRKESDTDVRLYAAKGLEDLASGAKAAKIPPTAVMKLILENCAEALTVAATDAVLDPPIKAWIRTYPAVYRDPEAREAALIALEYVVGRPAVVIDNAGKPKLIDFPERAKTATKITSRLIPLLQEPDVRIRKGVANTLGSFGPAAKAAIPALEQALQDDNELVRIAASRAILSIQPLDKQP